MISTVDLGSVGSTLGQRSTDVATSLSMKALDMRQRFQQDCERRELNAQGSSLGGECPLLDLPGRELEVETPPD